MRLRVQACASISHWRAGITLFEVVVAMVIFMVTLPALTSLIALGTDHAEQARFLAQASLECRSKLAEVTVGAEPFDSTDWVEMSDPFFFWKMEASDGEVTGLKQVQVSVKYENGGTMVQASLSQYVLDPANRGSTQDRGLLMMATPPPTTTDPAADPAAAPAADPAATPATPTTPTTPAIPDALKNAIQNKLGGLGGNLPTGRPAGGILGGKGGVP